MKDYRQLLTEIYQQYNPDKLDEIPKFLEKYAGREEELLQKVRDKYHVTNPDQSSAQVAPADDSARKKNIEISGSVQDPVELLPKTTPANPTNPEILGTVSAEIGDVPPPVTQPPISHQPAPPIPPQHAEITPAISDSYTSAYQQAFPVESPTEKRKKEQLKWILIGVSILLVVSAGLGYWYYVRNNGGWTSREISETEINPLLIDTSQQVQVDTGTVGSDNFPSKYEEPEIMGDSEDQLLPVTDESFLAGPYLISTLGDGRAFFHNEPNEETRRQAFVVDGDVVEAKQVVGEYVYVEFTNAQGKISKGWIKRIYLVEGNQ